jgi:nickel/cobalt transporter (NiCoT) family protein
MGLTVGGLSLAVAGFGILKYASPAVSGWSEGKELALGLSVIMTVAASFLLAVRLSRGAPAKAYSSSI